jgi:hypothetical protein
MGFFSRKPQDAPSGPMPVPSPAEARETYVRDGDFDLHALVVDLFGAAQTQELLLLREDFELSADDFYAQSGLNAEWDGQTQEARETAVADARTQLERYENEEADDANALRRYNIAALKAEVLTIATSALYGQ